MSKRPGWWLAALAYIWPITWQSARATRIPVIGKLIAAMMLPLFSKNNLNITYIPINRNIASPGSIPLPARIVEELIRRSAHRVIINRCTCRDARGCREHPVEYGCTLLGEGAKEIDPRIARHVSVDEAIAHFHDTLNDGLIPMTGRVKIDNFIWGVRDRGRLLTVCHCCRCCCTILNSGKYLPDEAASSLVRLHGLTISVDTKKCKGCGTCVAECFMGALTIRNGISVRDEAKCKGCGRCGSVCPNSAIDAHVNNIDAAVHEVMGRISRRIIYE